MTVSHATILWLLTTLEAQEQWIMRDTEQNVLLTVTQYTVGHAQAWTVAWASNRVERAPSLLDALLQAPDAVLQELATYPKAG